MGTRGILKTPSLLVTLVHWVPRSASVAVILAPVTEAPVESVTLPVNAAVTCWPQAEQASHPAAATNNINELILFTKPPVRSERHGTSFGSNERTRRAPKLGP